MSSVGQVQDQKKEIAKFEAFHDTVCRLDLLGDKIEALVEWINNGSLPAQDSTDTQTIKSVNNLLNTIEGDLANKYIRFEELLDRLLISLRISRDINLVRSDLKKEKEPEHKDPKEDILDIEKTIAAINNFWNVCNTLENIQRCLTDDTEERVLMSKIEIDLKDFNKSIVGIFGQSDIISEIVKLSEEKLEDIRSVFA